MNSTAKLTAAPAPDYAGTPLTRWSLVLDGERIFQDVDQWGLPCDLYAGPCDQLTTLGRVTADALNIL